MIEDKRADELEYDERYRDAIEHKLHNFLIVMEMELGNLEDARAEARTMVNGFEPDGISIRNGEYVIVDVPPFQGYHSINEYHNGDVRASAVGTYIHTLTGLEFDFDPPWGYEIEEKVRKMVNSEDPGAAAQEVYRRSKL